MRITKPCDDLKTASGEDPKEVKVYSASSQLHFVTANLRHELVVSLTIAEVCDNASRVGSSRFDSFGKAHPNPFAFLVLPALFRSRQPRSRQSGTIVFAVNEQLEQLSPHPRLVLLITLET